MGNLTFPLLPDKQTSKCNFLLAAPLLPLFHTSCDTPNPNPCAIREVPVHVSHGAGPLSQGNQCSLGINQTSSKAPESWLSARSELSLISVCLLSSILPQPYKVPQLMG